jgi:hypothetical protein
MSNITAVLKVVIEEPTLGNYYSLFQPSSLGPFGFLFFWWPVWCYNPWIWQTRAFDAMLAWLYGYLNYPKEKTQVKVYDLMVGLTRGNPSLRLIQGNE